MEWEFLPYSESVKEPFPLVSVFRYEQVILGFPVARFARIAVEMRECEISAVLCEHIEGRSVNRTAPATLERVFVRTQFRK